MLRGFRYIILFSIMLFSSLSVSAQLDMPDSVIVGSLKHYYVDPNPLPGSTYIWKIDGVVRAGFTSNEIIITWNTAGTFLLEVQELSGAGCRGPLRSGQVVVTPSSIIASSDLSIIKTADNLNPIIGHTIKFNIAVINNGPDAATGVTVTEILEGGYTYISSVASTGTYSVSTGIWTIGTLNNGESANLTISVLVNSTGSYVNSATIGANETDTDQDNNNSSVTTLPTDFFIPGGFSPNGDGINDLFVIRGIANYPNNTFIVLNRWGVKVFEAKGYHNTWDGRATRGLSVGGNNLPTGTYFYYLDPGDGSAVIKGTIYLNR